MTKIYASWFKGISSDEILKLLKESRIISGIELGHIDDEVFKIHSAGLSISLHQPFIQGQHWETNLANPRILEPYKNPVLIKATKLIEPGFISYHFGYSCMEIEKVTSSPNIGLSPLFSKEETMQRISENINKLRQLSKKDILVENMDYGATGAQEYVCEPEFIIEFMKKTECGFLLDISHARVSASELRYTAEEYITKICKNIGKSIKEIHINGLTTKNGKLTDSHEEIDAEAIKLLKCALKYCSPELIVIEESNTESSQLEFAKKIIKEAEKIKAAIEINS